MKNNLFYRLILIILLVSCGGLSQAGESREKRTPSGNQTEYLPTPTVLISPSQSMLTLPSPTSFLPTTPTKTQENLPGEREPFPTPVRALDETKVAIACISMTKQLPGKQLPEGNLLLSGKIVLPQKGNVRTNGYPELYQYDFADHVLKIISDPPGGSTKVSPDKEKYAILDETKQEIIVFSADGKQLASYPSEQDTHSLAQYLENDQIVLTKAKQVAGTLYYTYPMDVLIIDPFIQKKKEMISVGYPDIDTGNDLLGWSGGSTTIYDPTLTRVVYPTTIITGADANQWPGYILWDLVNHKILARLFAGSRPSSPQWTEDGSKFFVNGYEGDFYTVTREGSVNQITRLNPEPQGKKFRYSEFYTPSPDGKMLALWLVNQWC